MKFMGLGFEVLLRNIKKNTHQFIVASSMQGFNLQNPLLSPESDILVTPLVKGPQNIKTESTQKETS